MFSVRDQENLVHGHQTTAAAKPLNQGIRGIAPKTPGPNGGKIPFGGNNFTTRKPVKDDENTIFNGGKKGGNADKQAFFTPLAPKDRAPLGAKTANAKGQVFKTPAPGLQKTQKRTTSARKTKLKIHQPDVIAAEPALKSLADEDDVPDIEYCPPKIIPLPDLPDDPYVFTDDYTSPLFNPSILFAGHVSTYDEALDGVEPDGRTRRKREAEESQARYCEERDAKYTAQAQALIWGTEISKTTNKDKEMALAKGIARNHSGPSFLDAKTAASALASKPQSHGLPHFAAPTAATRAKSTKAVEPISASANVGPRSPMPASAHATIGYSAGRKVSASLKPNAAPAEKQVQRRMDGGKHEEFGSKENAKPPRRSDSEILQELLWDEDHSAPDANDDADSDLFNGNTQSKMPWDTEEGEAFQLDPKLFKFEST